MLNPNPHTTSAQDRLPRKSVLISLLPHVGIIVALGILLAGDLRRVGKPATPGYFPTGDFRHFYWAGQSLRDGQDLHLSGEGGTLGEGGYVYPPLVALLYAPLANVSFQNAAYIMLVFNTLVIWLAVVLLAQELAGRFEIDRSMLTVGLIALIGLLADIDKVKGELQMWQTNGLILLSMVLGLRYLDRSPLLAGLALGLSMNVKYQAVAIFPYLLLRRRYRAFGWMVFGCLFWAFVPALYSGWTQNLRNLKVAIAGLLNLLGVQSDVARVHIYGTADRLSYSITSGLLRKSQELGISLLFPIGLLISFIITLFVAARAYGRADIPLWFWPPEKKQQSSLLRAIVAIEYITLACLMLVYSPQTNSRHLVLALFATLLAATILLSRPGRSILVMTILALIILIGGFVLPPGSRGTATGDWTAAGGWRNIGGPCWTLWIATLLLMTASIRLAVIRFPANRTSTA